MSVCFVYDRTTKRKLKGFTVVDCCQHWQIIYRTTTSQQHSDMTPKRGLITDTFKVVKKTSRGGKRDKSPSPPIAEPEPPQLSEREKALQELKKFDLDWKLGPCTGISRMQRWERAALHGLNPPQEIKGILLKESTDPEYTQSLWCDYPL